MPNIRLPASVLEPGGAGLPFDGARLGPFVEDFGVCLEVLRGVVGRLEAFEDLIEANTARQTVALHREEIRMLTLGVRHEVEATERRLRAIFERNVFPRIEGAGAFGDQVRAMDAKVRELQRGVSAMVRTLGLCDSGWKWRKPKGRLDS
ncbi:MAG: hypothetical protein MUE63_00100 [Xanthomonadales bacterium]|jgi:hypothetical protein|nr:hypothetical protein [Xanthomonadales bacterium]